MIKSIPSGGYSYTVEFCREISRECIEKIHKVYYGLKKKLRTGFEVVVGLSALTIYYDPRVTSYREIERLINETIGEKETYEIDFQRKEWVIPVVYGDEYGLDMNSVTEYTGLTIDEVVKLHSGRKYLCYAIGFTPGFIYLGDVDNKLITPRLETPRLSVPPGSVGIADKLTGVYSVESPGGWRIIGRTPLKLIDFNREKPLIIKPGDIVSFKPISKEEFNQLRGVYIGDYVG